MAYFPPHFMMPPLAEPPASHYNPPMINNLLNNYDLGLGLGQNQQMKPEAKQMNQMQIHQMQMQQMQMQMQQMKPEAKHEVVDHTRYGFDTGHYTGNQPASVKEEQKISLSKHKMKQDEEMKPNVEKSKKTHDCKLCPYQTSQLTSLKRHTMAKHSGAEHPCDKCEYKATTVNNLRLHKNSKHDNIRYPCDLCGYQATQMGGLNRHKEQKHGHQRGSHTNTNVHHTKYESPQTARQQQRRLPTSPKQPLSGFSHFSSSGWAKVKAAHPEYTDIDVSKELGRRWHSLDDMTKTMFEEMAAMGGDNYNRGGGGVKQEVGTNGSHGKGAKKDPNAPKRSLSAFMFFSNAEQANVRQANPEFRLGETAKELGRRWAEVSTELRAKYVEMAGKDKERYEKEKQEYHMSQQSGDVKPLMNSQS
jgi:high mobility group protein B1